MLPVPPLQKLRIVSRIACKVGRAPEDVQYAPIDPGATPGAHIATVTGRYFAMDRDNRWDRVGRAYHAILCREGHKAPTATAAVEAAYARGETDEFVEPSVVDGGRLA